MTNSALVRVASVFVFLFGAFISFSISIAEIFLLSAFLMLAVHFIQCRKFPAYTPSLIDKALLIFIAVWVLSSSLGLGPVQSLKSSLKFFHFICFYLLLCVFDDRLVFKAFYGFVLGAFLAAVFGLGLYLYWNVVEPKLVPDWMSWFGLRIYNKLLYNRYRAYGVIHPLTYAEIMVPGFLIVVSFLLQSSGLRRKILWLIPVFVFLGALLVNKERGPWVGALAGMVVLFFYHRKKAGVFVAISLFSLIVLGQKDIRARILTFSNLNQDLSTIQRIEMWRSGWYVARHNIFFGVGPKQLGAAFEAYSSNPDFPLPPAKLGDDMHNMYLSEFAQKGLFGLFSLFFLFGSFIWIGAEAVRSSPPENELKLAISKGLLASFVAFAVFNLTERAFDDSEISFMIWLLAAMAVSIASKRFGESNPKSRFLEH